MSELLVGLTEYFVLYNTERPHQSPGYETPDQVYRTASGGGARIVDKHSEKEKTHSEIEKQKKKQKNGAAPFRCMKKVTLLNSTHYCLDRGGSLYSAKFPATACLKFLTNSSV